MPKLQPELQDQKPLAGDPAAFPLATNIDRRQCKRVVPLRVLALGVSRSGTSSLRQALIDLGYKDCYHYASCLQENPRDQDMWIEAYEAKYEGKGKPFQREDWDQLLGHCQAITDTPAVLFYRELLAAYPEAKVILTVRDNEDQWFDSIMATIMPYFAHLAPPNPGLLTRMYRWFLPGDNRIYRFFALQVMYPPMFKTLWDDYHHGTQNAKQWYREYNEEIKSIVPAENLLVMNVKQGWDPLCEFLGEEKPLYPFPRKNDTAAFQQLSTSFGNSMHQVAKWNMLKTFGTVLGLSGLAVVSAHRYGLLRMLQM